VGAAPAEPRREPSPAESPASAQPGPAAQPSSAAAPNPAAQPAQPGSAHAGAAALWQQKLAYLLEQEAILASPAQRFELAQQIAECRTKLAELGVEP
jgi:hypothetical protein